MKITLNILKKKGNSNLDKNKIAFDINLYDKEKFDLKETDYFVLSTNSEQIFKENTQLFNNYGKKNNETLLINHSKCLIDNKYDSSNIILTTKNADKFTANFVLEHMIKNLVNLGTTMLIISYNYNLKFQETKFQKKLMTSLNILIFLEE